MNRKFTEKLTADSPLARTQVAGRMRSVRRQGDSPAPGEGTSRAEATGAEEKHF